MNTHSRRRFIIGLTALVAWPLKMFGKAAITLRGDEIKSNNEIHLSRLAELSVPSGLIACSMHSQQQTFGNLSLHRDFCQETNQAAFPNRAKRRRVCHHALEHRANCPRRITRGSRSARKAVSQLLVADLWLCATPRPYPRRSTGSYPKFFCIPA